MIAAGSPGVSRSIRKTNTATIAITGMSPAASRDVGEHRCARPRQQRRDRERRRRQLAAASCSMFQNTGAGRHDDAVDVLARRRPAGTTGRAECASDTRPRAPAPPRRSPSAWPDRSRARSRRAASPSPRRRASRTVALSQPALRKPVDHRVEDVGRHPGRQERVPAAGSRRVLLGAARDQRLPVHRLHVDLEAGLLQQRLGDRRQVGQHLQVGRLHQHDRRAVVAGLLQQLLRLVEVGLEQPVHALVGRERRAADEQRLADLVVLRVADHRLEEVLLVEARTTTPGGPSELSNGLAVVLKRNAYWLPSGFQSTSLMLASLRRSAAGRAAAAR